MKEKLSPFFDLVRSFDTLQEIHPMNSSYHQVIRRRYRNKILVAVGIPHSHYPDSNTIAVTRRELNTFFERTEGEERVAYNEGGLCKLHSTEKESIEKNGEAGLVTFMTNNNGFMPKSPEPPLLVEATYVLKQGFTKEQAFYHYFARPIYQMAVVKELTNRSITEQIEANLAFLKRELTDPQITEGLDMQSKWDDFEFSAEHFLQIHNDLFPGQPLDDGSFYVNQTQRLYLKDTVIQRISRASHSIRRDYLLQETVNDLQADKNVIIVYGADLIYISEPAFASFGSKIE